MDRKDVLNSPEYWTSKTQIELYNQAQKFMEATGKDRAHLAEYLPQFGIVQATNPSCLLYFP